MNPQSISDTWQHGDPYERYIGRWSRRIAPLFLTWLDLPEHLRWVDVGCGTGALSAAIADTCLPRSLIGVEPSDGFLAAAIRNLGDRTVLKPGNAASLPLNDGAADAVVSGLVLNFIPDVPAALAEMLRITSNGGTIAAYVWDYADQMEIIRLFWDTVVSLDPGAANLHEAERFPLCNESALRAAFEAAGLTEVATIALNLSAEFTDFDDYWTPFLGGQGPAPGYVVSLPEGRRTALRDALSSRLAPAHGAFSLSAGTWAVRGIKRGKAIPEFDQ